MHSFLPTYLGGTFLPLLDVSEWNFFQVGEGCTCNQCNPPPAYAPVLCALFTCRNVESSNMSVNCE